MCAAVAVLRVTVAHGCAWTRPLSGGLPGTAFIVKNTNMCAEKQPDRGKRQWASSEGACVSRRPAVAVSRVAVADGCVVVVGADRGLAAHRWLPPRDAGAFTFSAPVEAGFAVEADPAPPRALGAPFAADVLSGHCYAVLPGSQARSHPCMSALRNTEPVSDLQKRL